MDNQKESSKLRAHVFITGRVQGVSFRWYTQSKAQELDLSGWVRNLWDGRVEAIFEGQEQAVREAVSWCRTGPSTAHVDTIDVTFEEPTGDFERFRITW